MIKAFLLGYQPDSATIDVTAIVKDSNNPSVAVTLGVPLTITASDTTTTINASIQSTVQAYCTLNGFPVPTVFEWFVAPSTSGLAGLVNAPQAAITDCPADAVTNYNVVTTLLGGLTGAVNTANTKQNQIATQLNALLAELRTLGLITP